MNKLKKISFSFLPKRFSCIFVLNLSVSRLFIIFSLNFKNAHNRKGIQNQSRIPLHFKNMRGCVYSKAFRMRIRAAHLVLIMNWGCILFPRFFYNFRFMSVLLLYLLFVVFLICVSGEIKLHAACHRNGTGFHEACSNGLLSTHAKEFVDEFSQRWFSDGGNTHE